MPAITATAIGEEAYGILNVLMPGEPMPGALGTRALTMLNRMISQWRTRTLLIPVIARERFDMTAGKGSPTNPYTIGDGGDFDTERPATQNSIVSANLILTASSPEVRVPLGIYTDQAYDANQIPSLSNSQPTGLYYNPTYASDLGSIFLWPVPDTADNDLELFLQKPLAKFATLTTTYYVPDGADDALVYQLALRLAGPNGRTMAPDDKQIAVASLAAFKRANTKMSDLMNDFALFTDGRTTYNIETGAGG